MDQLSGRISKFLSGERLSLDELAALSKLLDDAEDQQDVLRWLKQRWLQSREETTGLEFEQIRRKIRRLALKAKVNRLTAALARVAAALFIPLMALSVYLSRREAAGMFTLCTQKGEQTALVLPDGSKAWLNVDTRLGYPADYGIRSRRIELEGEAYFEVEENGKLPFEVSAGALTVRAIGTRFAVSAWPEQGAVKSSLVRGSIEIRCGRIHTVLQEGQQLVYHTHGAAADILPFDEKYELAWKNSRLTFWLTPFAEVIARLEKWYDIRIEYEAALFESETLTVRFERYETLEHVLRVMAKVHGFRYAAGNGKVILSK
jgi:ferric-dicitrate binding protein FerR (iron transport regulator)